MKRAALTITVLIFLFLLSNMAMAKWEGVDKTVVEKFATEANRPPRTPFINTDQGDLLLFVFLISGVAGGFAGGYYFRTLFPPKEKKDPTNVDD